MKKCSACLLPSRAPGADITNGLCAHCRGGDGASQGGGIYHRPEQKADLTEAIASCLSRSSGRYDCLVALSGGKDSCYLLHRLTVEHGLRALAFTVGGHLPEVAWSNIRRTVAKLDVDHLVYTPPADFYRRMVRHLLTHQEPRGAVRTVCYVCAPLTEGYALQVATGEGIPLVFAGYSPGQPEPGRLVYEFPREMIAETDWTPPVLRDSGLFGAGELERFWNPKRYPAGTRFPRFIAPFHAWDYSQEEVMKAVVELGLIRNRKHASPVHSNCRLNWLLMYSDLRNLGYNPYAPEFARLIREGRASRSYWRMMQPVVDWMIRHRAFLGRNVTRSLRHLGLEADDLRIVSREESPEEAGGSCRCLRNGTPPAPAAAEPKLGGAV
ncbi:MAG TPA: hypothetical protein PK280_04505 [Planctomycetota bacterium]|nr:hypothetical protein [Planctomycetota bacterium]